MRSNTAPELLDSFLSAEHEILVVRHGLFTISMIFIEVPPSGPEIQNYIDEIFMSSLLPTQCAKRKLESRANES